MSDARNFVEVCETDKREINRLLSEGFSIVDKHQKATSFYEGIDLDFKIFYVFMKDVSQYKVK